MSEKNIVQKVIAGGIVVNNDKVLIVQRASNEEVFPNLWEVPSGKKEPLENILEAVVREVKEETGLETEVERVNDVFNFIVEKETEIRDATQINFILKTVGKNSVTLSSEHQNFAWISLSEIDNYNLSSKTKKSIKLAFEK